MSYFPEDIPFMSEEERKANGIKTAKEIETQKMQLFKEDATFDCISRQKAISEAKKLYAMGDCYCDEYFMVGMLNSLPPAQPEIIRCMDCKYSEHWYRDKRRCFLWHETGIDVFEDGYCNYAKRRTDADMRGKQDDYEKKDIPLNTNDIFDAELAKRILNNK